MDPVSIAAALVGAQMGDVQMAVAAKMLRMNADNASAIVQVLDAAQKNLQSLANVAEGVGPQPQYQRVEPGGRTRIGRAPP